jgi:hypothetical protein
VGIFCKKFPRMTIPETMKAAVVERFGETASRPLTLTTTETVADQYRCGWSLKAGEK